MAKRQRVAAAKAQMPLELLRDEARRVRAGAHPHALVAALRQNKGNNLIAEFKRRSPSKGKINSHADPATVAETYESAGASAVSVLTEQDYFDGSLEDLRRIREVCRLPILRKDFIVDEYQVYESAFVRADALLLICAALDDQTLTRLREITEDELGMDALVEVHTKAELDRALSCGARLIGVNNRDLRTFKVSVATSEQLARFAPRDAILVSESGLDPESARKLRNVGYHGFLVGETLMRAADPEKKIREFLKHAEGHPQRPVWIKICGITNASDAHAAIEAGADMLGFNFYPRSPRFIEPQAAAEIVAGIQARIKLSSHAASRVGVFVNETAEEVLRIADEVGLNGLQLHGDETPEFCARLKKLSPHRFVIKTVAACAALDLQDLGEYPVDAFMIDAFDANLRGGTGRLADWSIASQLAKQLPRVFLAGGLAPENVAEAILAVRPYAVDACSALEVAPGNKSVERMKEFVDAVRSSKLQDETSIAGEGN